MKQTTSSQYSHQLANESYKSAKYIRQEKTIDEIVKPFPLQARTNTILSGLERFIRKYGDNWKKEK